VDRISLCDAEQMLSQSLLAIRLMSGLRTIGGAVNEARRRRHGAKPAAFAAGTEAAHGSGAAAGGKAGPGGRSSGLEPV